MIAHVRQTWSSASLQQAVCQDFLGHFVVEWCAVSASCSNFLHQLNRHSGATAAWFTCPEKLWPFGWAQQGNYCHNISFQSNLWWSQTPRLLVSVSGLSLSTMWNTWVWNTRNAWKCLQSGGWSLMDCMPRHAPVFASGLLRGALRHLLKASLPQSKPSKSLGFEGLVKLQLSKSRDTWPTNRICM